MLVKDASFFVAGGSSGLGLACVQNLLALNAKVTIADMTPPPEPDLPAQGESWTFHQIDVTSEEQVRSALNHAADNFGPVRGTLITAGIIHSERIVGPDGAFDLASFQRVIDVNLVGSFNVMRLSAEAMKENEPNSENERGTIITTSSVAAYEGQIGQAAYSASKGGIAALTLPAARELGRYGIRVMSIAPGVFETPMLGEIPEKHRTSLEAQPAFPKRFGRPTEFAALVAHILENPMLNGEVIRLDGGIRMSAR